ncbi:MAG: hypothetical protein GEU88_13590 [Solirubrobacterales bacterium]|nr:hypothetical protein [Solirubrobacterales bacterium]
MLAGAIVVPAAGATTVASESELRAAFEDAGEARIDLAARVELHCVGSGGGALQRDSATPLTLNGHGFAVHQTCTEGESNVLLQDGGGALTLKDVTITGGDSEADGGGVLAIGPVTVIRSEIVGNAAVDGAGGGIASDGAVTVIDSSISSNHASQDGGIAAADRITVLRSTISGNEGGGITGAPGPVAVNVTNSTVADNFAAAPSAGIFTEGVTTLVYATVVRNRAQDFPNIDSPALVSFASVVALPLGSERSCLVGSTISHGYNLSDTSRATCGFDAPTDRPSRGDPMLAPLAANGGPTPTMLPLAGSPLLDAIPAAQCRADGAAGVTSDQRGVTRPQGGSCDIGAVEVAVPPPPPPNPIPAALSPAPEPPSNRFRLGAPKRNKRHGTARLRVTVPGPGVLRLVKTKQVRPTRKDVASAGKVNLRVRPRRQARRRLRRRAEVRVRARATYSPEGGEPRTKSRRLTLRLEPKRKRGPR